MGLNEIVYLGDDDKTDIFCAINAGVLPFAAKYSKDGMQMEYGIQINHPKALIDYLTTYARQSEPYFGWTCNSDCEDTETVMDVRALFGEHGDMELTKPLVDFLKDHKQITIGSKGVLLGSVLFHYLVSQVYLNGLIQEIDCVAVYPGHLADSTNPILETYSDILRQTFRQRFMPNLLVRHVNARKSQWVSGAERDILEQFRTILVKPDYCKKIIGTRVLVLDDFTTSGASLETSRRMLLNSGASKVIGLAMAKYRSDSMKTRISGEWNSFEPCNLRKADISVTQVNGNINRQADAYFHNNIWPVYSAE